MNGLFSMLGIDAWKPIVTVLLLPPVPLLLAMLAGAWLLWLRRGLGWILVLLGVAGLWLSACTGMGRVLEHTMLHVPPALDPPRIAELRREAKAGPTLAIVVLGGGVEPLAPEYGVSNLAPPSLERLHYGLWLARETGAPVAFTGGIGWAQAQSMSEAEVAARIAAEDFKHALRWTENQSRDTRENAGRTLPLLKHAGITHILLVTHGAHMPRAQRAFEQAAASSGIRIEAAPLGLATRVDIPALDWLPTHQGYARVRIALREWLGRIADA